MGIWHPEKRRAGDGRHLGCAMLEWYCRAVTNEVTALLGSSRWNVLLEMILVVGIEYNDDKTIQFAYPLGRWDSVVGLSSF